MLGVGAFKFYVPCSYEGSRLDSINPYIILVSISF